MSSTRTAKWCAVVAVLVGVSLFTGSNPVVATGHQADAKIRKVGGSFKGNDIYGANPDQDVLVRRSPGSEALFEAKCQADLAKGDLTLRIPKGTGAFTTQTRMVGRNFTTQFSDPPGMYFDNVRRDEHTLVATFKVKVSNTAVPGQAVSFVIACGDGGPSPGDDVVRAEVRVV